MSVQYESNTSNIRTPSIERALYGITLCSYTRTMSPILISPEEHEPLIDLVWNESRVRESIQEICTEADQTYNSDLFWPEHPDDADWTPHVPMTSLFWGAGSTAWTLLTLRDEQAIQPLRNDYILALQKIYEFYLKSPDWDVITPSYLFGESGLLAVLHRFAPSTQLASLIFEKCQETIVRPENELMWAAPGAMIVARSMLESTHDPRWKQLLIDSSNILISRWKNHPEIGVRIWTQDLYGKQSHYLGAVHGFAGNVFGILISKPYMPENQLEMVLKDSVETLLRTALRSDGLVNWKPALESDPENILVQWCHGSPGIVTALGEFPKNHSSELENLLVEAGELIWRAGPLKKPFGLCHGTAGNGYAFLKLYRRTGNTVWLDRARRFAIHALDQSDHQKKKNGKRRFGLLTGDLGLAYYLWSCIKEDNRFPLIDFI